MKKIIRMKIINRYLKSRSNKRFIAMVISILLLLLLILNLSSIYGVRINDDRNNIFISNSSRNNSTNSSFNTLNNSKFIDTSYTWPMFRGNNHNTGTSGQSIIPKTNRTLWVFNANNTIKSSPAVVNERVYFATSNGTVISLNQQDGSELWRRELDNNRVEYSSPCVVDDKVVIGTLSGQVFCLDSITGSILWNTSVGDKIQSSPKIYNNTLYLTSYDSNIYSINLNNGSIYWKYSTTGWLHTTPAIVDEIIYIGGCGGILHGLYEDNRTSVCDYNTGNYIVGSPAYSSGKVFFGTHDTGVFCINSSSGALLWSNSTVGTIKSSPAISDNFVIFADSNGRIFCFNTETGNLTWSFKTDGPIYSSPAIAQNKLVIGSGDNIIYCLNLSSGEEIWNFSTKDIVESSPALAYDKIFIGSDDGNLYCFGNETGVLRKPIISILEPKNQQEINITELEVIGNSYKVGGSVEYVEIMINSSSWLRANGTVNWFVTINISNFNNGEYILTGRAFDGEFYSLEVAVNIILNLTKPEDVIPHKPVVNLIKPLDQQELTTLEFEFHGNASKKGGEIEYVEYKLDTGSWERAFGTTSWNITINFSDLNNGVHKIYYRAFDGKNYSAERSSTFILNYTHISDNGNGDQEVDDKVKSEVGEVNIYFLISIIIVVYVILMIIVLLYGKKKK